MWHVDVRPTVSHGPQNRSGRREDGNVEEERPVCLWATGHDDDGAERNHVYA